MHIEDFLSIESQSWQLVLDKWKELGEESEEVLNHWWNPRWIWVTPKLHKGIRILARVSTTMNHRSKGIRATLACNRVKKMLTNE